MKALAFILILVAVLDVSWSVATLIPERKLIKQAWGHDKKQFAKLFYSIVCDILAVIVFIAYLAS
jgi:hypothetical protein